MNTSDWIALAALVIAVVGTVVNYLYTKKTFEATNFPDLHLDLSGYTKSSNDGSLQETMLNIEVRNQSSSVSVKNIDILVYLSKPFLRIFRKSLLLRTATLPVLQANHTEKISFDSIHEDISKYISGLFEKKDHQWFQKREVDLEIKLIAQYKPSIRNSWSVSIKKEYVTTPLSEKYYKKSWRIVEMK